VTPWEQDFDVYLAELDGGPASFVVDLAAGSHAPVETHPLLATVRVPMRLERPDGLRHADELPALGAIEDQVVERLGGDRDAIYVGHVVHGGVTTLYLYLPAGHGKDPSTVLAEIGPLPEGYTAAASIDADPAWKQARALAPDAYAEQTIWNRRLVRIFEERGDALDLEREVDHMAYFPTAAAAESAGLDLRAAGFRVDEPDEAGDGEEWGLAFHRDDVLAGGRPDDFVAEIFAILRRHAGRYDGWGAESRARDT
jgi:hypothetical protein